MANSTVRTSEPGAIAASWPDPERYVERVPDSRVEVEYVEAWDRYRGYARLAKSPSMPSERQAVSARRAEYWHRVAELLDRRKPEPASCAATSGSASG